MPDTNSSREADQRGVLTTLECARNLRTPLLALAAFVVAFILYALTADGGPQWQDSGEMQIRVLTGQVDNWRGLAFIHAPHYYLGRVAIALLPGVEPARAITIIASGLTAAIGIACIVAAIAVITRSRFAAIVGGAMLMFSHTYWQHATVTECYGVSMACFGVEWLCLAMFARTHDMRWLAATAVANGFGITNHMLAALATPALAGLTLWAAWRSTTRLRLVSVVAVAWLVGLAPYLAMMAAKLPDLGIVATVKSALVGEYGPKVMNTKLSGREVALAVGYVGYNLPNLALPLALFGLLSRRWPGVFRWTVAAQLAVFLVFAVRYRVPDAYAFFFPAYMAITLLAGLGMAGLTSSGGLSRAPKNADIGTRRAGERAPSAESGVGPPVPTADPERSAGPAIDRLHAAGAAVADFKVQSAMRKTDAPPRGSRARTALVIVAVVTAFWQPIVYVGMARFFETYGIFASLVGNKPYRNGYTAFFIPWGSARDYAWKLNDKSFELAGPDGLILLEDEMAEFSLPYSQITRNASRGVTWDVLKWPEEELQRPLEHARRNELVQRYLKQGKPVVLMPRDRDYPAPEIDGVQWRRVEDLYIATPTATLPEK